ncbi:cell wall hydrolase [Caulobacter sp. S45]|uniref:cell wall hydrolase n=1 Tax=Caulobacter sp. S45 TaxID=1641861 RepID=UPI00131D1828|nr:cell wall hydrolase [Caulobacter sp. S45]
MTLAVGAAAAMLGASNAIAATPSLTLSLEDRDALTRVAVAEAGNQGDSGIAAVVQTILNRLVSGGWGVTVEAVVDAPHQFEPVARVGGDWRRLPAPTQAQSARVDTILALVADGRMPDFVGGALYFQNPRIVASRIAAGTTPADRLNFGGRAPLAVVGDHAFYGGPVPQDRIDKTVAADPIFIGKPAQAIPPAEAQDATTQAPPTPPERGIFILANGRLTEDLPRPASDH